MCITFEHRTYTEHELICRVWDIEDIMDLMNRRVYYVAQDLRRQELNDLWVRQPDHRKSASFGRNYGYYLGMEEIIRYYVADHESKRQAILDEYCAAYPELTNTPDNLGIGFTTLGPTSTPVVELAQDGVTARGIWYSLAQETTGRPNGKSEALWRGEKVAADFIREDGLWKIWHLVITTDFTSPAGVPHESEPFSYAPGCDPLQLEFGSPTLPVLTHDNRYHWSDDYPCVPQPYETYTPSQSYTPEGHPGLARKGGLLR